MPGDFNRLVTRRRLLGGTLALGIAGLGSSCSDGKRTGGGRSLADLLGAMPDPDPTSRFTTIFLNDYERAWNGSKLARVPVAGWNDEQAVAWARAIDDELGIHPSEISGGRNVFQPDWSAESGISFGQVTADAFYESPPPTFATVLYGEFEATKIDDLVSADPVWASDLERRQHEGVEYYRWSEDLRQFFDRRSLLRPLGVGQRMAVSESRVFWTAQDSVIQQLISVEKGTAAARSGQSPLPAIADAMEKRHVHSAGLASDVTRFAIDNMTGLSDPLRAAALQGPKLGPFEAAGTGTYRSSEGPRVLVVLCYANSADAANNVAGLAQRLESGTPSWGAGGQSWSQLFPGKRVVKAEGNLLIAELPATRASAWRNLIELGDSLLAIT